MREDEVRNGDETSKLKRYVYFHSFDFLLPETQINGIFAFVPRFVSFQVPDLARKIPSKKLVGLSAIPTLGIISYS